MPIININAQAKIEENDVVICFNFRTDRLREFTTVFTQQNFPDFDMKTIPLKFYTMTEYNADFKGINIFFRKDNLKNTIGEIVSKLGLNQLRIAETEKYAHVTFFFSGGREHEFENEKRILIPSPKVATYDLQPEMSAYLVRDELIREIKSQKQNLIIVNFANGDMVGHTGFYNAVLKAVEVVDTCVKDVITTALENNYQSIIIADHGNSDYEINEDGSPNTQHSLNPVPFILVSNKYKKVKNGVLADVAPTILNIMGIEKPIEMTGNSLIIE
jgi:2,3-bisphosphoglycerate-independent phosphoglycerate mutase